MDTSFFFTWPFFLVCVGVALVTTALMSKMATQFYTKGIIRKPFSIFDLEFPAQPDSVATLVRGIHALSEELSKKVLRALKGQLYLDFLFMPGVYLSVWFLCQKVALLANGPAHTIFWVLSLLQFVAWLCDITENLFLLAFIRKPVPYSAVGFIAWQYMEGFKWGSSLIGFFASAGALLYYWLTGRFGEQHLYLWAFFAGELVLFWLLNRLLSKKDKSRSLITADTA